MSENPLTHDDYTVRWICALPETELVVAGAMLDEEHPMLHAADPQDTNSYLLGKIGSHNVVIACLPAEKTGTVSAAVVAKDMLRSFQKVRFGLMVGIGGGAPLINNAATEEATDGGSEDESSEEDDDEDERDIRLGDVVISLQSKVSQAVIQYDFGKSVQGGKFIRNSTLNKPPNIVLNAVSQLQARHKRKGHKLSEYLNQMVSTNPAMMKTFRHPGPEKDRLFKTDCVHVEGKRSCKLCCGPLNTNIVKRKDRATTTPMLHYGTIGSADRVMKDPVLRDKWSMAEGILCFEMEAAGKLLINTPLILPIIHSA
jgi:nucleoside phosphorylase